MIICAKYEAPRIRRKSIGKNNCIISDSIQFSPRNKWFEMLKKP